MAEVWKPQPINVLTDWIETIREELSDDLTSWELTFIDSISVQLDTKKYLSQKQEEILERIYSRTP